MIGSVKEKNKHTRKLEGIYIHVHVGGGGVSFEYGS